MALHVGEQEEGASGPAYAKCRNELTAAECMHKTSASPKQTKFQHGRGVGHTILPLAVE